MIAVQTIHVFFWSRVMEGLDVLSTLGKHEAKLSDWTMKQLSESFVKLNLNMFALRFYLNMN